MASPTLIFRVNNNSNVQRRLRVNQKVCFPEADCHFHDIDINTAADLKIQLTRSLNYRFQL